MDEEVVVIMGATGAGKSSLVKMVTEDNSVVVGHSLTSETQEIHAHPFPFAGRNMTLVDTPGFNDTYTSDGNILQNLVSWLTKTYKSGQKLSAIIYLHNITDVRLQGSSVRNLRVFQELCGADFERHVVLCASFWSHEAGKQEIQQQRIDELTSTNGMWTHLINSGARVFKEPLTRRSAIRMIFEMIGSPRHAMQVQREMVDEQKPLDQTSAVSKLMSLQLERAEEEHAARMTELKEQVHEEMRIRERTHSENLEGMRRVFEEKLAVAEAVNRRIRAEIEGPGDGRGLRVVRKAVQSKAQVEMMVVESPEEVPLPNERVEVRSPRQGQEVQLPWQAEVVQSPWQREKADAPWQREEAQPPWQSEVVQSPWQRPSPPPPLHRAATTTADSISIDHEMVMRRKMRYNNFAQHMTATIQLLEKERQAGKVKCNWFTQKSCYTMVCTHCLKNIGSGYCYKCIDCSHPTDFILCHSCHSDLTVHCNDPSHPKSSFSRGMANLTGTQCPRVRFPPQDATLLCGKCGCNVGRCYLHCCACGEGFDMCVACAVRGKGCGGGVRGWGRHRLEICGRFVPL